ncbi:MAG: hypothetical protein ACYDH9_26130 [Limisphaerales bacterium]
MASGPASRFCILALPLLTGLERLDAAEKSFLVGGINLTLQDRSDTVGVRYQSMRLNRALNVWNVEVSLTNRGTASLQGPFILLVDAYSNTGVPLQPDGHDDSVPAKAFFDLSNWTTNGVLPPGAITRPRTLSLVWSNAVPNLATRVYAKLAIALGGLAVTRSLNEVGQPLTGVQVIESGPQGQRTNFSFFGNVPVFFYRAG